MARYYLIDSNKRRTCDVAAGFDNWADLVREVCSILESYLNALETGRRMTKSRKLVAEDLRNEIADWRSGMIHVMNQPYVTTVGNQYIEAGIRP